MADYVRAFFEPEMRSWTGKQPLWKVFWIYGVLVSFIVEILFAFAIWQGRVALQQALLICFLPYTFWLLVSVWRCADNVKEARWGVLARQLTVVWAGNTMMVVAFLQLDLIAKFLGR